MRKLLFVCLVLTAAMAIGGCTTRYYSEDSMPSVTPKLESGQVIYIAMPQDGAFGERAYDGSGQQAAIALQNALARHASMVTVSPQYEDAQTAIEQAKEKNARYVFVPLITNWVHRRAAWSGRASGVSVTITVYDLARESGDILTKTLTNAVQDIGDMKVMQKDLRVQGRNATFVSQYPGEILKPLLMKFAQDVF